MTPFHPQLASAVREAIIPALACILLASCSGRADQADPQHQVAKDPPGAAKALSIGGRIQDQDVGVFQGAINCATALRITASTLESMTTGANSNEVRFLAKAANIYRDQAVSAGNEGATPSLVQGAINRSVRENSKDTAKQAQLSIACMHMIAERL